ncbi:MAG: hypothetical protein K2W96_23235, partial [Gemmataceae bacterium]|nr:hypothetical protein [Gemmataceae bacterium]
MLQAHQAAGVGDGLKNILGLPCAERSDAVRRHWEQRGRVERIVFDQRGGLGFRAIQAKRAGLAFHDTILAVKASTSEQRLIPHLDEAEIEYADRYAWENADERLIAGERIARESIPSPVHAPLVTLCIPHYNLGTHL